MKHKHLLNILDISLEIKRNKLLSVEYFLLLYFYYPDLHKSLNIFFFVSRRRHFPSKLWQYDMNKKKILQRWLSLPFICRGVE